MASIAVTPGQKTFLTINRDALIYAVTFLYIFPPAINLVTGRYDAAMTESSGNVVWQAIEMFIFLNSLVLMRVLRIPLRLIFICLLPVACMVVWILLSVTWSDYPDLTIRRGLRLVIELVSFTILALSVTNTQDFLRILFRVFFVATVLDMMSIAVPSISSTPIGFAGFHGHKNIAGEFFFFALPIFFMGIVDSTISRSRLLAAFAFLSCSAMLVLSESKTSLGVSLFCAIAILASRLALTKSGRITYLLSYSLLAFLVALVVLSVGPSEVATLLFGDSTLTGRDLIWRYTLDIFDRSPFHGVGYGAIWQVGPQLEAALVNYDIRWGVVNEAHNGYIDILAQLGVVGIGCLIVFIAVNLVQSYKFVAAFEKNKIFGLGSYAIYNIWGALIYNITETQFFLPNLPWCLLIFVTTAAAGQVMRLGTQRRSFNSLKSTWALR